MAYYRTPGSIRNCKLCNLSNGRAIHSHSALPFSESVLLIYSAYPGTEEDKQGLNLSPSPTGMNAGKFFRKVFKQVMDGPGSPIPFKFRPTLNRTIIGNVIRCNPMQGKDKKKIGTQEIRQCHKWIDADLEAIDDRVPILLSGSEAVKSVLGSNYTLYTSRCKLHYLGKHPVIVCENFVQGAKYISYEITDTYKNRRGLELPRKPNKLAAPLIGSTVYNLTEDLKFIRQHISEYIETKYGERIF